MDIDTAIYLAERDLQFQNAFGLDLSRAVLDKESFAQQAAITDIARQLIASEIALFEQRQRVVRLNPIFQGREFLQNDNLVFVLSPFGYPYDEIYAGHIKPTVESIQGLQCIRANDIYGNRPIVEDIWRYTNEARILISELTGRNPNVFYETGIAHTVGKSVILITRSMDDVPFDLKHLRCIVYEYDPRGIKILEQNLKNTIFAILSRNE